MVVASGRRLGESSLGRFGRRGLLLVTVALACGAGGAAAQSGRLSAVTAHLYWTNIAAGTVVEANLDGTGATTIAKERGHPQGVAINSRLLYWSSAATQPGGAMIVEANINGTDAKAIVTNQEGAMGVAVGGLHLYWADYRAGTIGEANLNGTDIRTIATGQNRPWGVAVGSGHLYWSDDNAGTITEANLDGTDAKIIATGQRIPTGVAVNSRHLYWADFGARGQPRHPSSNPCRGAKIVEANLNGTGAKTIATGQKCPLGVAVGGGHLYWAKLGPPAAIIEANPNGTDAKTIAKGSNPYSIAWGIAVAR